MSNYLIIAGSSDIGLLTAKKLIALGHTVHITGREQQIEVLGKEIGAASSIVDASNSDAVVTTFEAVTQTMGGIDGVVNFAGSFLLKPAHLTSQQEFEETIKANLVTAFSVVHAAGKFMTQRGGSVVLLASAAAKVGLPNHEAIAAAKAGVIGLALSAAATYCHNHLRFNVVAPALIATKLSRSLTDSPASRKISESMHPLGRIGRAEDVASAILFFLMPENDWISGQVLAVDGGLSNLRAKQKV